MSRNTTNLKGLIFNILDGDATLLALLGAPGRVRHGNPRQLSEYPLVTYYLLGELDEVYNTDLPSHITESRFIVQSFNTGNSSQLVTDLDDQVYALLHGQRLTDGNVRIYTSYRKSVETFFESEVEVWRTVSNYSLVNVIP